MVKRDPHIATNWYFFLVSSMYILRVQWLLPVQIQESRILFPFLIVHGDHTDKFDWFDCKIKQITTQQQSKLDIVDTR